MKKIKIYCCVWLKPNTILLSFQKKKKHLSYTFPTKKGLKLGDALLPLLFNFALEYAIRCVQVNWEGFKLNIAHQFLVYADDVNISGRSILTMEKNTAALLVNSKGKWPRSTYWENWVYDHVWWTEWRTKSQYKHWLQILIAGGRVQIFGNNSIKSKLHAWIN